MVFLLLNRDLLRSFLLIFTFECIISITIHDQITGTDKACRFASVLQTEVWENNERENHEPENYKPENYEPENHEPTDSFSHLTYCVDYVCLYVY